MSNLKDTPAGIPRKLNETAWILTGPSVHPADLLSCRFRGRGIIRLSLGKQLVNLLQVVKRTHTPQIPIYFNKIFDLIVGVYFCFYDIFKKTTLKYALQLWDRPKRFLIAIYHTYMNGTSRDWLSIWCVRDPSRTRTYHMLVLVLLAGFFLEYTWPQREARERDLAK